MTQSERQVDQATGQSEARPGRGRARVLTRLVIAAPFSSAYIALILIVCVDLIAIQDAVSEAAFSTVLPLTAVLAIASLGQLLVIMNAGIDLSVPSIITLAASMVVGVSQGRNGQFTQAIIITVAVAALIGLVNGLLVVVARVTPVIATLATGGIVLGYTISYRNGLAQAAAVPQALAQWGSWQAGTVSGVFIFALALTAAISLFLRYTVVGRRVQLVGGNPRGAWMVGISVPRYQILAYTAAGFLYGIAGVVLASFIQTPTIDVGSPYLLAPIAAVVIAGTSLLGGTGSVFATFAASVFLTILSQTLRVLGLSSAWQFLVFGLAVAIGLLLSGDRVLKVVGARTMKGGTAPVWHDEGPRGYGRLLRSGRNKEQHHANNEQHNANARS